LITFKEPNSIEKLVCATLLGSAFLRYRMTFLPLTILLTNRCNSRCRICNIWNTKPKIDLPIKIIKKILDDKVITNRTYFVLTGGEVLLHPESDEILSLFHNRKYILLTNGLLDDRLIETVNKFGIKRVSVSLDGPTETYKRIRGVDGYANVERVVKGLKGKTDIRLGYVINPWNSRRDLMHVMNFCQRNKINFWVGYYSDMEYFEIGTPPGILYDVSDLFNHPYYSLYHEWVTGNLKMPCLSIFTRPSIRPNGDVVLCDQKEVLLGNLYEENLWDIWTSKRTRKIQKEHVSCNACWSDCSRLFDLDILSWIKPFVSQRILRKTFPQYDWIKIYDHLDRVSSS